MTLFSPVSISLSIATRILLLTLVTRGLSSLPTTVAQSTVTLPETETDTETETNTTVAVGTVVEETGTEIPIAITGDADCPCLQISFADDVDDPDLETKLGPAIDIEEYGINCYPHDENSLVCSEECDNIVPLPLDCYKDFCKKSWCYVDPDNCALKNKPAVYRKDIHYSYATCGDVDRFSTLERLRKVKGETFRVGYTSNSGGWKGAYNAEGSFAINNAWTGPTVEFIRTAALEGGFRIEHTAPPAWLKPRANEFFQTSSSFDYCAYAVSLGYLDFCVASYSITEQRSVVTTMFELYSEPVHLITFDDSSDNNGSAWENFLTNTKKVFAPFTWGSWLMIFFFALPLLGMLMLYHEYDRPGAAYPRRQSVLVLSDDNDDDDESAKVAHRDIPKSTHVMNSIYMGTLSFFTGSYDHSVVTNGGKCNLLAISSFVMFIIAIYTANLASILTQEAAKQGVDSIEMAVKEGLTICVQRNTLVKLLIESYGVPPELIVPDPDDGEPGFVGKRDLVFEQMKRNHNDASTYCNVAIASLEDLDYMHRFGEHCDKSKIGETVVYRQAGIPITDRHADSLVSLFQKVKGEGVFAKAERAAKPESQCPDTGGEGTSIDIHQLTGVWVVTFFFVLLALVVKFVPSGVPNKKERVFRRYDQWGNGAPADVVVNGYRYDAEGDELQEIGKGTE